VIPADWLLLFLAARPDATVDPVRLQKGLFLLAMDGRVPPEEGYAFEPYSYGPMSRGIYRDVRGLVAAGDVASREVEGYGWRVMAATAAGAARAADLRRLAGAPALQALEETRATVDRLSFAELLEHVYTRHPEFATRSVFRRRS
jgi:uncharacterized protein YwgA